MTAEEYESMLSGLRAYAAESVRESENPFSKLLPSLDALASAGIWSPKMPPLPCSTPGKPLEVGGSAAINMIYWIW